MSTDELDLEPLTQFFPKPPDGGYGWVVVAASFFANLVVDGIAYAFGMFLTPIQRTYGASKSQTALVGSLLTGCYLCVGPIVSGLVNKYGSRCVMMCGSVIACLSFIASAYAPSITLLMIFYGVFGGIGFGLIYLPAIVHCGYYFEKRRALATGIAVSGSGAGTFIFAPLSVILLREFGWQGSLWILAGLCLNCCVAGALLRPLTPIKDPKILQTELLKVERAMSMSITDLNSVRGSITGDITAPCSPVMDRVALMSDMNLLKTALRNSTRRYTTSISSDVTDVDIGGPPSITERQMSDMPPILEDENVLISHPVSPPEHRRTSRIRTTSELSGDGGRTPPPTSFLSDKFNATHNQLLRKRFISVPGHETVGSKFSVQSQLSTTSSQLRIPLQPRLSAASYAASLSRLNKSPSAALAARSLSSLVKHSPEQFNTPMARKDIFYPGSIKHLEEFKENDADMVKYRCSQLSIPGGMPAEDELVDGTDEDVLQMERILSQLSTGEFDESSKCCPWIPQPVIAVCREMVDVQLLRQPCMLLLCLSNILGMLGFYVPFVYLASRAESLGVDQRDASFLLSVIGITNTLGRIFFGWLADRGVVSALAINNFCLLSCGGLTIIVPLLNTYALMIAYSTLFGFFISAYISLTSIVLVDFLGLEALTNGFGLILLSRGLSCMVGSPLAGAVYDATHSYDYSFFLAGGLIVCAGLVSCLVPFIDVIEQKLCCFYASMGWRTERDCTSRPPAPSVNINNVHNALEEGLEMK